MNSIKRNSSQYFPVKINSRLNETLCTDRIIKSTSNPSLINVNKNKHLKQNKSCSFLEKKAKNERQNCFKNLKIKKDKSNTISPLMDNYNYNNNNQIKPFLENYICNNDIKKINVKHLYDNSSNFFSYGNKFTINNYNSNYFLKDNSKYHINNTINNINTNNIIKNSILSYNKKVYDQNLFNKKQVYQKPKNDSRLSSSSSFAIVDSNLNSNKENINLKSNCGINNYGYNFMYANYNKLKKYNSIIPRMNDTSHISSTEDNISNYIICNSSKNTSNSFFNERKTNKDFSKLNLYSPRDCDDKINNANLNCLKKTKSYINKEKMFYDGGDNDSILNNENYKTYNYKEINNNKPFIYVRKNSSKNRSSINSSCRKKNGINNSNCFKKELSYNDKTKKNKIRVNLKLNHIFENAFYVQKNVILIQKNYRMHLGILKKYILKAIENIIEGTNKLYYIFYKYYFKKLKYIMNDACIKSISVNMKSTNNNMNFKNKYISNEINNNLFSKTKNYYMVNRYKRNKNVKIIDNKNNNKYLLNSKSELFKNEQNYNFYKTQKGDIIIIKNLKNQKNK